MKNKHLIFLFLAVLLTGLISRVSPWFRNEFIRSSLIKASSQEIRRITISKPEQAELLLEADESNWSAEQDDLVVGFPDSMASPLINAIAGMKAVRIIDEERTDTTGLTPGNYIEVCAELADNRKEVFRVGLETVFKGMPGTYVQIIPHGGIYLVEGHLRTTFDIDCQHFRSREIGDFSIITGLRIIRSGLDSTCYVFKDSTGWSRQGTTDSISGMQTWLKNIRALRNLKFANPSETGIYDIEGGTDLQIELAGVTPEQSIRLDFYGPAYSTGNDSTIQIRIPKRCLLHSSANPYNYFFVENPELVRQIATGPALKAH